MSSEKPNAKLNVQTTEEGLACAMENKNTTEKSMAVKVENSDAADDGAKCNAEDASPAAVDTAETKCDICNAVDVENITNSLAEKVNIKVEADATCDTKSDETNKEQITEEVTVPPEKSVNKVSPPDISKVLSRGPSLNKSTVIVNHKTDSFKNLLEYDSSSNDEVETEVEPNWQFRTIGKSDSDSDESLSSDTDEDDDDDDEEDDVGSPINKPTKKNRPKAESPIAEDFALKIYAENNVHDLPPIRDVSNLDIDMEKEEFLHMGHIEAVIETLITVEAIPGTPAYDLDTCLFVEDTTLKRPLGAIYDVIGPVASPLYCIRFKCTSDVASLNLKKGTKVFCAPKSQYTKYVFVSELMRHRGTDASWVGDREIPPEIAAELSDDGCPPDEQETRRPQKRKHGSQERHKRFEEDMNRCNTLNSHAARLVDSQQGHSGSRISRYGDHVQRVLFGDAPGRFPPSFDPTIPPPGFHSYAGRSREPFFHQWSRPVPVAPLRPPRCNLSYGQGQGHFPGGFTGNGQGQGSFVNGFMGDGTGHGAGTSSRPH